MLILGDSNLQDVPLMDRVEMNGVIIESDVNHSEGGLRWTALDGMSGADRPFALPLMLKRLDPCCIVYALGVNDLLTGMSDAALNRAVANCVKAASQYGKVWVVGAMWVNPDPNDWPSFPQYDSGEHAAQVFNCMLSALVINMSDDGFDVEYIPPYRPTGFGEDGIHIPVTERRTYLDYIKGKIGLS